MIEETENKSEVQADTVDKDREVVEAGTKGTEKTQLQTATAQAGEARGERFSGGGSFWVSAVCGAIIGSLAGFGAVVYLQTGERTDGSENRLEAQAAQIEELGSAQKILTTRIDEALTAYEARFEALSGAGELRRQNFEVMLGEISDLVSQASLERQAQGTQLQDLTEVTVGLNEEMDALKTQLTDLGELETRFDVRLDGVRAELEMRLAQFESVGADAASDDESRRGNIERGELGWQERLDVFQSQLTFLEKAIATLQQEMVIIRQLQTRVTDLEMFQNDLSINEGDAARWEIEEFERLDTAIAALQREVEKLQQMLHSPTGQTGEEDGDQAGYRGISQVGDQSMAALISANSLKAAIDRGGSYQNELQIFTPLAPDGISLDLLERHAAIGLPNLAELNSRFARLADEIAATENTLAEDAGLTDRLLHQGQRLYSSRPVGDIEGTGAGAIAARMEVAIGAGDFTRALAEARALPEEAQVVAADFVDLLQARQAVDELLSRLIASTLQKKLSWQEGNQEENMAD